jgi:hypothetical protein
MVKMTCSVRNGATRGEEDQSNGGEGASLGAHGTSRLRGERFLIERRGRPLAALVGVEDLERLEGEQGSTPSRPLGAIALVGAWGEAEEGDLDAVLAEIYAERRRDTGRPVDLGA